MTAVLAVIIGLVAAALLLVAGYQLGLARGRRVRDDLRTQLERSSEELKGQLLGLSRSLHDHQVGQRSLEADLHRHLQLAAARPDDMDLRRSLQEMLRPLLRREQLGHELARLDPGNGRRQELPRLLDDIAATGGFSAVVLTDDAGLPLAASAGTSDPEHYAGLSSLSLSLMDRMRRDTGPTPVAVLVHNTANEQMLSRLFAVSSQRLLLTAVSPGADLSPTALDPALHKLEGVLTPARS